MKKGVVIALCAAVVVAGAVAVGWWVGRGGSFSDGDGDTAAAAKVPTAAEMAARVASNRQRIEQHRYLWREASYIEIRQAAESGDLMAQRRLSEVYEDCLMLNGKMHRSMELLTQLAVGNPRFDSAVNGIVREKNRLCVQAGADLAKNPTAADYWLHKSAKSGDTVSEIRFFSRTVPKLSHSQYRYFIDKVRETGDPDAIFELSLILPKLDGQWPDETQAPAFHGRSAEQAWILAACRAGYDCARGSRLMNIICLTTLSCAQPDFEHHLAESGGDVAMRAARGQQVALIEKSILTPKAK